MISKILIANRGEIAARIIRTCKKMGIQTLAVYSDADSRSAHVLEADETAYIGPSRARDSYLNKERLISEAISNGCDAIHPGYGFLSENADFARMVAEAGLLFIGPPASVIEALGDKISAKTIAQKIGAPIVPGYSEPILSIDEALEAAETLGFPLLLKPAAGGGGRGMRVVAKRGELASNFAACQEEARKGFADDRIFLERYLEAPRHIEFQIMADSHGSVIHLGERECSIQRRYQKIIEEAPSTVLTPALREKMGQVSCELARAAGYQNAGTVEFILDSDSNFYFLEMNTRLQVEHPITEMISSLDLVELQIRITAGEPLPVTQQEVALNGWAIEARICAEDPVRGFMPTIGIVTRYSEPRGKYVRVDSGVGAGSAITIFYDSLLAKVSAWGENREIARQRLVEALNGFHLEGLATNVDFVNAVINHPDFTEGRLSTNFIEGRFIEGQSALSPPVEQLHFMTMAAVLVYHNRQNLVRQSLKPMSPLVGAASRHRRPDTYIVRTEEDLFTVTLEREQNPRTWAVSVNENGYTVVTPEFEYYRRRLKLTIDGVPHMFRLQYSENHIVAFFCGIVRTLEIYSPREWNLQPYMLRDKKTVEDNVLRCPMPGLITDVKVREGASVHKGDELLRIESMKMESVIASPCEGVVGQVPIKRGDTVETGDELIIFLS